MTVMISISYLYSIRMSKLMIEKKKQLIEKYTKDMNNIQKMSLKYIYLILL